MSGRAHPAPAPRFRCVTLEKTDAPFRGHCPACGGVMDQTGCRIIDHRISVDPVQTSGIFAVVEVDCIVDPTANCAHCAALRAAL